MPTGKVIPWLMVPLSLVLAACAQTPPTPSPRERELQNTLDDLAASMESLRAETSQLHEATHQLEAKVQSLEQKQGELVFDAARVGPSRAQYLPNPPEGMVAVRFVAQSEDGAIPGNFTFHLAPEGSELFETLSLPEGEELVTGPQLENGLAFVEPGVFYRLQVVYRNPSDQEVRFLVRGGVLDPQAALPFVRNRCWCAALPFSVPPRGTFSRIIDVGVGPDTPPGAKAVVVFPLVRLEE